MDKKPIGYQQGKPSILDKKVPVNPKYSHIESTLAGKTGTTVKDIEVVSNKVVSNRKGQLFKRMKPTTLQKLILQQTKTQSIYKINQPQPQTDTKSQISNFTSVTIKTTQLPMNLDTEFLLLDLRDPQQYDQYHIIESINYPAPNIKRDKPIPQLFHYKNKQNKIIVVYHFDEKKGIQYATEFYEKGYDNVYLVNGGIEGFAIEVGSGFLEGKKVPEFKRPEEQRKFVKKPSDSVGKK